MEQNATLNARLPMSLKQHGCEVLEREGVGVSEVIRALFEYLECNQKIPEELAGCAGMSELKETKRASLRSIAGAAPIGCTTEEAIQGYRDHLVAKHCPVSLGETEAR